jgi:hypothetical protein
MRLLGAGLFRSGYKIRNCDLVIKFPGKDDVKPSVGGKENRDHSLQEVRRLKRLMKDGTLNRFLPEIFYHDKKTGVVVMRYYPPFKDFEELADALGRMIGHLIFRVTRVRCTDVHTENVRRGQYDRAILIDLGY